MTTISFETLSKREKKQENANLEVEMKDNDNFTITWLEYGVFDVVVQYVNLVTSDRGVPETCMIKQT